MNFFAHQQAVLDQTEHQNRVAYYLDMGLGKTYVGAEKMFQLGARVNLVICQKSKIEDWMEHFRDNYKTCLVYDLTGWQKADWEGLESFNTLDDMYIDVFIINYELAWRRTELLKLRNFTLMLDESSMIQNENCKQARFILSLEPKNVILLSGTPTAGKYEKLWSQCHLLGWSIPKKMYWKQYVETEVLDNEGYPITVVRGYKNVERLKRKLREHGAVFMKADEVLKLPDIIEQKIRVPTTPAYKKFRKDSIVYLDKKNLIPVPLYDSERGWSTDADTIELVGDTTLTKMLYERMLCGQYNREKLGAFRDILESTNDRLVVFYNFKAELEELCQIVDDCDRPFSIINGDEKDLDSYNEAEDSVTLIQYQAGAMGLNLQKANKIVYFTPPLKSELFEQSKARIRRIGQKRTCFYYYLICHNSIEEKIYKILAMRRDYTDALYEEETDA